MRRYKPRALLASVRRSGAERDGSELDPIGIARRRLPRRGNSLVEGVRASADGLASPDDVPRHWKTQLRVHRIALVAKTGLDRGGLLQQQVGGLEVGAK